MPYNIITHFEQSRRGSSWRVQDAWHGMTLQENLDTRQLAKKLEGRLGVTISLKIFKLKTMKQK